MRLSFIKKTKRGGTTSFFSIVWPAGNTKMVENPPPTKTDVQSIWTGVLNVNLRVKSN